MMLCNMDLLPQTDAKLSFLEVLYSIVLLVLLSFIPLICFYILSKALSKFLNALFSTYVW